MPRQSAGRRRFLSGLFQFIGTELKTMSRKKIKSLYNMTVGYAMMKFKKRQQNQITDHLGV